MSNGRALLVGACAEWIEAARIELNGKREWPQARGRRGTMEGSYFHTGVTLIRRSVDIGPPA